MLIVTIVSFVLVVVTTLVHYEVLRVLSAFLPVVAVPRRARLVLVILAAFGAHAIEMVVYGLALFAMIHWFQLGSLIGSSGSSLEACIYFSAETYTSLGFGDVTPVGPIRLLAGVETLNGLLLIGWSASYTYLSMEEFWKERDTNVT